MENSFKVVVLNADGQPIKEASVTCQPEPRKYFMIWKCMTLGCPAPARRVPAIRSMHLQVTHGVCPTCFKRILAEADSAVPMVLK